MRCYGADKNVALQIKICGVNGRIEIFSAKWDEIEYKASTLFHYDNSTGNVVEYRYAPVSPFDHAVQFFRRNIEERQQGVQSCLTGYEVDELIENIKKSSDSGQAIDIEWQI